MPYIIVRGNLAYDNKYPWRVLVSGLRSAEVEQLKSYPFGGYSDPCTVVYLQHPCVILTALENLGYQVVASSSTSVKQDYNEYMWTMKIDDPPAYTTMHGETTRVQNFLRRGINPDEKDSAGFTALHYASRAGHLDVCRELLCAGANPEIETRCGKATALHRAAASGKTNVVKILLENGASTTKQDADGRTALHRSAMNKHDDITEILIEYGPECIKTIRDNWNKLYSDYK